MEIYLIVVLIYLNSTTEEMFLFTNVHISDIQSMWGFVSFNKLFNVWFQFDDFLLWIVYCILFFFFNMFFFIVIQKIWFFYLINYNFTMFNNFIRKYIENVLNHFILVNLLLCSKFIFETISVWTLWWRKYDWNINLFGGSFACYYVLLLLLFNTKMSKYAV